MKYCAPLVPESTGSSRWLLKNFRSLAMSSDLYEKASFAIETVNPPTNLKVKAPNEKYNEPLAASKQISDIASQWGTQAHAKVRARQLAFLQA
ncbi:hypothetical protein JG688_00013890 [Phytophthora aleatoria]|uniref:Uncharacterized protein n=1 Tax=Phytophthora aleatoria TaxID=2496075 RepID=A0A8J5J170_9STRA|nr:hypothetical protein JG688_00013890 [Phytophthora aleatoria]